MELKLIRTPYLIAALILLPLLLASPPAALCQSPLLLEGIDLYKKENYGEAAKILERARAEDQRSSTAAFFLGLAYKQLMDYQKALPHLRDAVTLEPRIKEALVELIEVLFHLYDDGKAEEAEKWIGVAEREEIYPAKVAFLKGLLLAKQGKQAAARESFERAKSLDISLAQSADVQIAISHLNENQFKKARDQLGAAIQRDPTTDLAGFARRYQDLVEKKIEMEKPLRTTFSAFGQYDTNVVLRPTDGSLLPVTNEESRVLTSSLRVDYLPVFEGPWIFNAQYAIGGKWHEKYSTSQDFISNSIYAAPGYNFGKSALNLALRYNHALVRDPSYKQYVDVFSAGPLYRTLLRENQILEFFVGYSNSEYARPISDPDEDRDSDRFNSYISWVWLFRRNGFLNLKYEYSNDDTDGGNWANIGHSFSFALTLPLIEKLSLQLSGEAFLQDYRNVHTTFQVERDDEYYTGTLGLSYALITNLNLIAQYTRIKADSNIPIYDYKRSIYAAGFEYRF